MALSLRPRQVECLDSIRNEYLAGCYQQLVVAATGIGKVKAETSYALYTLLLHRVTFGRADLKRGEYNESN